MLEDWVGKALCGEKRYENVEFFVDSKEMGWHNQQALAVQAICLECPVRVECATHAVLAEENLGIWGATIPADRRRLAGIRRSDLTAAITRLHSELRQTIKAGGLQGGL